MTGGGGTAPHSRTRNEKLAPYGREEGTGRGQHPTAARARARKQTAQESTMPLSKIAAPVQSISTVQIIGKKAARGDAPAQNPPQ